MKPSIVIDTCVFISALRSRLGASFRVLSLIDESKYEFSLSVPLVFEYEAVAKRLSRSVGLTHSDVDDIIDYMCALGALRQIHFLWRPNLKDPGDDFILELAVEAECKYIVTHNLRDFAGADKFGIKAITPQQLLRMIGEIK